jgi:hypothetical protein
MKALRKRTLLLKKQMKYAISEANILKNSKHPFILGLHYCFQVKSQPNFAFKARSFSLKLDPAIPLHGAGLLLFRRLVTDPGSAAGQQIR